MAGADITQLCSVLLHNGLGVISELNQGIGQWLDANEYESLAQLKGSMSYAHTPDPSRYERSNYLDLLDGWGR